MSFVHLHCHSEYSLLDGANRIDDLIERALEFEQPALAITDHGNMHAAWEFQEKAREGRPQARSSAWRRTSPRATGAAAARAGPGDASRTTTSCCSPRTSPATSNLVKLSSLGYTEGFYTQAARRPRAARQVQRRDRSSRSACMAGEVAHAPARRPLGRARATRPPWYADVFKDRYYLEVQAHDSGGQAKLNDADLHARRRAGPAGRRHQRRALPARRGPRRARRPALHRPREGPQRRRPHAATTAGCTSRAPTEMRERFPDRPDVLENTLAIADEVGRRSSSKKYHVPSFPLPQGVTSENELLVQLADGRRDASATATRCPPNVQERLDYELDVITKHRLRRLLPHRRRLHQGGARPRHSRSGPGRGSAAGSLVAYALAHHRRLPAQVRPALRALPESGARVDARHRRRLLLRAPRRGDRVRAREVRQATRSGRSSPSER